MSAGDSSRLNQPELRTELHAAVGARRELGPELEDEVLATFLARVDRHIDQRLAELQPAARPRRRSGKNTSTVEGSMALSIPLIVVAGIFGGPWGIAAVVAGLVVINLLGFIERSRAN